MEINTNNTRKLQTIIYYAIVYHEQLDNSHIHTIIVVLLRTYQEFIPMIIFLSYKIFLIFIYLSNQFFQKQLTLDLTGAAWLSLRLNHSYL